jgi:hypothetical protein
LSETDIIEILDDIVLLPADKNFSGSTWLTTMCEPIFAAESAKKPWYEIYRQLISLLYTIGFLGIAKGPQGRAQYSYENPGFTQFNGNLPENVYFEIHPAFRQALNILEKQN